MSTLPQLLPLDEHNQKLQSNVHPTDWENPTPDGTYNMVVIGGGTAGLVTAAGSAGVGAKVALIEKHLLGGDCLNVGCVPSKAIIAAAASAAAVRDAGEFGVNVPDGVTIDFGKVMERMRKLRSDISPHDSAKRFKELGIDIFLGGGKFIDANTIEVDGKQLKFKKACIATGARASAPPVKGLDTVEYLTNETLFSLTELPKRFGIIGTGPIGVEMAQSFARLGSEVYLVGSEATILDREDPDAARLVQDSLEKDGVNIIGGGHDIVLSDAGDGQVRLKHADYDHVVDKLLIAVGRAPNVEGLGLEEVGIKFSKMGVEVNDKQQTTVKNIYAAGDICSKYKFTHAADFLARNVIRNALFLGRAKSSTLIVPWATYSEPELAHVGHSAATAKKEGVEIDTYKVDFGDVDRAILSGQTNGFVKVHCAKGSGDIVGATVVGENAGDMISELALAMTNGLSLGTVANTIHPYPTVGEAIRKAGDLFNKSRFTPKVAGYMKKWLKWSRR